jgi:hypothetical protein
MHTQIASARYFSDRDLSVGQGAPVLQLFPCENQSLLITGVIYPLCFHTKSDYVLSYHRASVSPPTHNRKVSERTSCPNRL